MNLIVNVGGKLLYTKRLRRYRNSRFFMKIKALKLMGISYYYD